MTVDKEELIAAERAGRSRLLHDVEHKRWRLNGKVATWKTRPDDFSAPVKHGLYAYAYVTNLNAIQVHWADECPLLDEESE